MLDAKTLSILDSHGFTSEKDHEDADFLMVQWFFNLEGVLNWLQEKRDHPNEIFIRGKWQTIEQALN